MTKRILALILCAAICVGVLVSCKKDEQNGENPDALVIMTELLDGIFNPFFSTSGADSTIVSMTQISMLTSKYENGNVAVAYGDNEAVVVKDFESVQKGNETVYTFVLKNGIKYSDGQPLTMEDVLFNLYVYLDPVYTGSATMYSTDIKGLSAYRTQTIGSSSEESDKNIANDASNRAAERIKELKNLFLETAKQSGGSTYYANYETMKAAILATSLSDGYKSALAVPSEQSSITTANLLADYDYTLKLFREELEADYASAAESYTEEPYKSREEFKDAVFCFMYNEGYVDVEWAKDPETNKVDKSKIEKLTPNYNASVVKDKESAINFVYEDKIASELHIILDYWATATTLRTEYSAKAKEVILHEGLSDGEMKVSNIEGIVSLGHTAEGKGSTVTVNGNSYKVASAHNEDGTVAGADEYDVLQITINGVDPKAVWNFAFAVAPQHYYGEGASTAVDIENNKFGVDYASADFMQKIIQSPRNIKLPVGAGAYKVTNRANSDTPSESEFFSDNVVYFKANNNFETVGSGINNAKIEKVRYQVVSATNAISSLESGSVHYIVPQLTSQNFDDIVGLANKGVEYRLSDQLGYGYIGINAGKVQDINIRKAILCAMNTTLALDYYRPGTASQIYWPMSTVSWAYPTDANGNPSTDNGRDYPQLNNTYSKDIARENIEKYMREAGVSAGDSSLKITFTIAGSNLQDHPTYKTFRDAADLLNEMGWDITVQADTQALTKLNTGSLAVWAAAWGSTIDPDLYQVYHKNSTATSTLAWGYPSLKDSGTPEEQKLLNELSDLIDQARETLDQNERTALYEQAMGKILDLGIELPVYQRSVIYAYNSNVISSESLPSQDAMNPYTSPLDRIWELEFAN